MKPLVLTVISIIISVVASLAGLRWLGIFAGALAIAGACWQQVQSHPFEWCFADDVWQKIDGQFQLTIPKRRHGKSHPTATVYMGAPPKFQQIGCDISTGAEEEIIIGASQTFRGKVVVV